MSYRDPIRAAAERIRLQREDMRRKRAVLTEELVALLPEELGARLQAAEAILADGPVTADNLDTVQAQMAELAAVLDAIGERIPAIEQSLEALPRHLPRRLTQTRLKDQEIYGHHQEDGRWMSQAPKGPTWAAPLAWIRYYIHQIDPAIDATYAKYIVSSDNSVTTYWHRQARFTLEGMPVDFEAWSTRLTLTVPVRASTPDLYMRPETWSDSLAKRFWGRRDAEVGDWRFDDRFLIDADPAAAEALLDPAVRNDVAIICRFSEPWLNVENGLCRLRYTTDGSPEGFEAALDLLKRIHRAKFDVELLHDEG